MKQVLFNFCIGIIALFLLTISIQGHTANKAVTTASQSAVSIISQQLTALKSGSTSDIDTFGVLPQNGDYLDAGDFTITIDQSFAAGQVADPTGQVALRGEFVIEAGVTLTVNGDWDASQLNTQNIIKKGARVEFDGVVDATRRYKTVIKYYTKPSLVVQSTAQVKAFFGLKPNSAATFIYDKQNRLGANISGGNIHLNGFSTGYEHHGHDREVMRDCNMPDVLLTNSGQFKLAYSAGNNGTCDMKNLTILSPTVDLPFRTVGTSSSTTQGADFNLNGLSVDGEVAFYTRPEFLMNDWVLRDLAATLPQAGWQNVDSWLLFNVHNIPVGSRSTSNIYFRAEKYNPHGFSLTGGALSGMDSRTIDSVIFDFNNTAGGESGDMYLFSGPATANETVRISNNIALKNLNGQQSSTFMTFNDTEQGARQVEVENNVVFIPSDNRAIALNEASLTPTNTLSSIKNNIFWGQASQSGYVIGSLDSNSAVDILANEAYSHNGVFNALADGEHGALDLPLSYVPNSAVTAEDPAFYDDQRRLATYGASVLGLDGTAEAAFNAHLTRHLSPRDITQLSQMAGHEQYASNHKGLLLVKYLIDWVKKGFIATNTSYQTSSSTAGVIGLAGVSASAEQCSR